MERDPFPICVCLLVRQAVPEVCHIAFPEEQQLAEAGWRRQPTRMVVGVKSPNRWGSMEGGRELRSDPGPASRMQSDMEPNTYIY